MTSAYESGHAPPILVKHRLRIAREYAELEQEELATLIGVSRKTVGNAETGRVQPRRITLNAWALACGVPVSWIENGGAEQPPPPDRDDATAKGRGRRGNAPTPDLRIKSP